MCLWSCVAEMPGTHLLCKTIVGALGCPPAFGGFQVLSQAVGILLEVGLVVTYLGGVSASCGS